MKTVKFGGDVYRKIITQSQIQRRVKELAAELKDDYKCKDPLFVCLLSGAAVFTTDLMRALDSPAYIGYIKCSSYVGVKRQEKLNFELPLKCDVRGRDVVIIEDLIDSGHTLFEVKRHIIEAGAASCSIVVLINKPENLKYDVNVDYVGFNIAGGFIVGNGFDVDGYGRGLKDIYQK